MTKQLQKTYENSEWVRRIGVGAIVRNQHVPCSGAVYALQQQLKLPVHIAGRSALQLHGQGHYISMGSRLEHLWMPRGTRLPRWFVNNWGQETQVTVSGMLPALQGLTTLEQGHIVQQPWFRFVDVHNIDLGIGPRQVVPGGQLDKAYGITVPREERE